MKALTTLVPLAATLVLSACGGGGSSSYDAPPPPVAAPPAATPINFTTTLRTQLDPQAVFDTTDPIEVEGVEWTFPDDENESAFADILGAYDVTPATSM